MPDCPPTTRTAGSPWTPRTCRSSEIRRTLRWPTACGADAGVTGRTGAVGTAGSAGRRGACGTCGSSFSTVPRAASSSSYCSCVMSPLSFSSLSRSFARLIGSSLDGFQDRIDAQVASFQLVQQLHDVQFVCGLLGGLVVAGESQRRQHPVQTAAHGRVGQVQAVLDFFQISTGRQEGQQELLVLGGQGCEPVERVRSSHSRATGGAVQLGNLQL